MSHPGDCLVLQRAEESMMKKISTSNKGENQKQISADQARGGEIILRTRLRRIIFVAGLVGFVFLAVLLAWSGAS